MKLFTVVLLNIKKVLYLSYPSCMIMDCYICFPIIRQVFLRMIICVPQRKVSKQTYHDHMSQAKAKVAVNKLEA